MRSLTCFFLLALTSMVHAQGEGGGARSVYLRLLSFDTQAAPDKSFAFDPKAADGTVGVEAPIKNYLNHEGTTVSLTGNSLVFSSSDKVADLKKEEFQLASVNLPAKGQAFILIFLPVGKGKFKVLPLSDSVKDFPLGSFQMIGLSRFPIKVALENKPYEIKPGGITLVEDAPMAANGHSSMIAFAMQNGKWERISSGLWPDPGEKRVLEIFFDNPLTQRTELKGFRDISPLSSAEPEPTAP